VLSWLEKMHPIELIDEVVDIFLKLSAEGDDTTIRRLELLGFIQGTVNVDIGSMTDEEKERYEKKIETVKLFLEKQILDFEHPAIFKNAMELYIPYATQEEAFNIFQKITDAGEMEPHLRNDFYALWSKAIFSKKETQPQIKFLFDAVSSDKQINEIDAILYQTLKNFYSEDVNLEIKDDLVNYIKEKEPSSEYPVKYFEWMDAYLSVQSPDETVKKKNIGKFIETEIKQPILQEQAIRYFDIHDMNIKTEHE
jgi:hypothetical protein